ncbi:MAG: Rieske (2Fe-2S) protein [Nitrososphaeraceae archaeon]
MNEKKWHDLGNVDDLKDPQLREINIDSISIALSYRNGLFGAISNICNHVGGPLGKGNLDDEYIVCP